MSIAQVRALEILDFESWHERREMRRCKLPMESGFSQQERKGVIEMNTMRELSSQ